MNKPNTSSKRLKSGYYSVAITVFVVALIVVVNLIVNALPANFTKFDYSEQGLYTLSEQTKKLVKGLKEEVTIYFIAQQGNESKGLTEILDKYEALSNKLRVEKKDPAVSPGFVAEYTQDTLVDNSVIVVSDERSRVVTFEEMYETSINAETGKQQADAFRGEDMITSAIDYVTMDKLPKMYLTTGHEEQAIGSFVGEIQRENIQIEYVSLAKEGAVPADADCLMMAAPSRDITQEEQEALSAYLDKGGNFFYVSMALKNATPNLDALLADYGIAIDEGYVCEGNGYYYTYPMCVAPSYGSHSIVSPLAQNQTMLYVSSAQNITVLDTKPSNVKVMPLLRTSSGAYIKKINASTSQKEEGDKSGVMNLAAAIERNGKTQMVVLTTYEMFDSSANAFVSGGNYDFLLNAIGALCEHESMVSIRAKQLYSDSLVVTSGHAIIWLFVLMIASPLACLVTGLVWWVRRRKR